MPEVMDGSRIGIGATLPFTMTETAEAISDAAHECIRSRHVKLGWIIGPPGIGKTTALRAVTRRTPDTLMVTMTPAHATLKTALGFILREAFGYAPPRSTHETYEQVRHCIDGRGIRALIIDEAQESYVGLSNALRTISDDTGVAMIFCGNPKYLTNFGKEKDAFAQITSRLAVHLKLGKPTLADVMAICDLFGIVDQAARKFLFKCSQSHGALRIVHSLIQKSGTLAGGAEAIQVHHLQDAVSVIAGVA